jgi:hypothetical protein
MSCITLHYPTQTTDLQTLTQFGMQNAVNFHQLLKLHVEDIVY